MELLIISALSFTLAWLIPYAKLERKKLLDVTISEYACTRYSVLYNMCILISLVTLLLFIYQTDYANKILFLVLLSLSCLLFLIIKINKFRATHTSFGFVFLSTLSIICLINKTFGISYLPVASLGYLFIEHIVFKKGNALPIMLIVYLSAVSLMQ